MTTRVAVELYNAVFSGNRVQPVAKTMLVRASALILRSLERGTRMILKYIGNENDALESFVVSVAVSVVFPSPLVDPPKEWFPTTFETEVPSHIDESETRDRFQDAFSNSMKLAISNLFPRADYESLNDLFANAFGLLVLIRDLAVAKGATITPGNVKSVLESESLISMFYPMLYEEQELKSPSVVSISNTTTTTNTSAAGPSRAAQYVPPPPPRVPPPPPKIPDKIQFLNNLFGFNAN